MKTTNFVMRLGTVLLKPAALCVKQSAKSAFFYFVGFTTVCGVAQASTFFDGFETQTLNPFWSTSATNATIGFSTTRVHGGGQSLQFTTSGVASNKGAQVSHLFPSPEYGTASVWVFDSAADDLSGNYIQFYVNNSILGQRAGLFTQDYDLGPSNGGIYYYDAFTVPGTATTVDRTKAWHLFEIESLASSLKLSIDGMTVYTAPTGTPFDGIALEVHAPGFRPGLSVQYDDFQVCQVPEQSSIVLGILAGVGLLVWQRCRWNHA